MTRDDGEAQSSSSSERAAPETSWTATRPSAADLLSWRWWWVRWPGRVELLDAEDVKLLSPLPSMEYARAVPPA